MKRYQTDYGKQANIIREYCRGKAAVTTAEVLAATQLPKSTVSAYLTRGVGGMKRVSRGVWSKP